MYLIKFHQIMKLINVLQNDKGVVRVTFSATPMVHYAVKFFDESGEFFTVKLWVGKSIEEIQKYWSTQSPVLENKAKIFEEEARYKVKLARDFFPDEWTHTNKINV